MTKLRLELKKKNGDVVVYEQDKVPASRVLDFWNIQEKLEAGDTSYTPKDYLLDRIDFCASLFSAKAVTQKAILEGLNAWELEETIDDIILTAVGVKKEADPKLMELVQQKPESVS
ncbi:phage tail assembly chaperone G [Streptococcus anginosus]|uniref:phage tail assembly chaperone G n=1 Tax=Streptococcus anginosus TaxID=1328 RepID=UPI003CECC56B